MAERRDRHGRGVRGPIAWPPVPAMLTRSAEFDEVVQAGAARALRYLGPRHAEVEFAVEDVPESDPTPWEEQVAPLGRTLAAGRTSRRIVLYRRPIQARAATSTELEALVREVLAEQVAALLGVPPEEIEL